MTEERRKEIETLCQSFHSEALRLNIHYAVMIEENNEPIFMGDAKIAQTIAMELVDQAYKQEADKIANRASKRKIKKKLKIK